MNNKHSSSSLIPTGAVVALSWFAMHCGAGFATGNQEVNYFVKYGWPAVFIPFISMILVTWGNRNAVVLSRDHNVYDYKSYVNILFHPYEKYMGPVIEIVFIFFLGAAVCTSIAGAATLLASWGIPYGLGLIGVGTLLTGITIFGAELVIKVLNFKAYFILLALGLVTYLGIEMGLPNLSHVIATRETFNTNWGAALWTMLVYAGYQSFCAFSIVPLSKNIKTDQDCNTFMYVGALTNGLFLIAVCVMLLGYAPAILTETLPVYYVTEKLGIPWLKLLYSIILFIAMLGTGLAVAYGGVARFEKLNFFNVGSLQNIKVRRAVISIIVYTICSCISIVGLTNIVVKGYGMVGQFGIFLFLLPEIVIGEIKIRRNAKLRNLQIPH